MDEKIGIERPVGFTPKRLHLGAQLLGRQRGRAKRSKPTRIAYRSGQRRRYHARHGRLNNRVLRAEQIAEHRFGPCRHYLSAKRGERLVCRHHIAELLNEGFQRGAVFFI